MRAHNKQLEVAVFSLTVNGFEIIARTLIIYGSLLLALRVAGKREIGQMATFDLVVILLISNAVQNAMVGSDVSVTGGLIAAGALIAVNYGVATARERVTWVREAVEGSPTIVVSNGRLLRQNIRREGLAEEEVLMAIREHGLNNIGEVRLAVLETDGSISVVQAGNGSITGRPRKRTRLPWRRGG
ncbi:MAG: DUF421 domain-containing protein [Chloroflexi bacterium]|nr:MAG: DUF421 domain-containing protein [Chloroflexota bacterium]